MLPEPEITVTAVYVYKQLQQHETDCLRRWKALMLGVISNLLLLVGGLTTLLLRAH